jgi:hypothetical protein
MRQGLLVEVFVMPLELVAMMTKVPMKKVHLQALQPSHLLCEFVHRFRFPLYLQDLHQGHWQVFLRLELHMHLVVVRLLLVRLLLVQALQVQRLE